MKGKVKSPSANYNDDTDLHVPPTALPLSDIELEVRSCRVFCLIAHRTCSVRNNIIVPVKRIVLAPFTMG